MGNEKRQAIRHKREIHGEFFKSLGYKQTFTIERLMSGCRLSFS